MIQKPLREIFVPIGNRLYLYESRQYLQNNPFGIGAESDYPFEASYDYVTVLDEIEKGTNIYDPLEVYKEAHYYVGRVEKVKEVLERRTHKFMWNQNETIEVGGRTYPQVRKVELDREDQEILFQSWMDELNHTHEVLNRIAYTRSHIVPNDEKAVTKELVQINLPEKLFIKKLQKHYGPYLSPIQAAQLLQYLKDLQVIPPYGPTDIGRIGELLFGRHGKSITDGLLAIERRDMTRDDFIRLQGLLNAINKEIERDLKNIKL